MGKDLEGERSGEDEGMRTGERVGGTCKVWMKDGGAGREVCVWAGPWDLIYATCFYLYSMGWDI